ncbi:MAG: ATP-binding protein [Myxococcota bacterium]
MRTERIEETTEANRAAAEAAAQNGALPRAWGRMALVRRPRSEGALAALARLLAGATGAARSAVLVQAGELIRAATGADRVAIRPTASSLESGVPVEGSKAEPAVPARRAGSREIACLGPAGLLGRITLEGPAITAAAPAASDALLETIAALVAGYLERDRLERELVALRASRARTERLAQLGRVASSSAHDVNNVLTAILGYADLLELELADAAAGRTVDPAPAARGREELEEIRLAAARGAAIVEEVLGFSRERVKGEQALDLGQIVAGLVPMLRRVAGPRIAVESPCEAGLPAVRLDGERLERVLVNLVANARHAIEVARAGGPGRIAITLERARGVLAPGADALRLVVRDDGCGMSPDVRRRIFEPFFTTRSALGGTGIGLADAADFVRRAGGRIDVESREGEGTAIALVLPVPAASAA